MKGHRQKNLFIYRQYALFIRSCIYKANPLTLTPHVFSFLPGYENGTEHNVSQSREQREESLNFELNGPLEFESIFNVNFRGDKGIKQSRHFHAERKVELIPVLLIGTNEDSAAVPTLQTEFPDLDYNNFFPVNSIYRHKTALRE